MMAAEHGTARVIATSLFGSRRASLIERTARVVIAAIVIGIGTSTILLAVSELPMGDLRVYLAAAERLAAGEPLYKTGAEPFNAYWYSPWLAVMFMPATAVPYSVVVAVWLATLLAASGLVIARLARLGPTGVLAAGLVGPLLIAVACGGNVQPLLIAALLYRVEKRDGPVWIALAASLKVTPILFVLALIAGRRWGAAAAAFGIATILWLPAIPLGFTTGGLAGWDRYAPSLMGLSFPFYVALVLIGSLLVLAISPRHRWLASSATAVIALPRLFAYDVTLVLVGAAARKDPGDHEAPRQRQAPE